MPLLLLLLALLLLFAAGSAMASAAVTAPATTYPKDPCSPIYVIFVYLDPSIAPFITPVSISFSIFFFISVSMKGG